MTSCPLADFSYLDMVDGIHGSESYQTSNRNVPCAETAVELGAGCTVGIAVVDIQIGGDVDIVADVAVVVGIDVDGIEVAAGVEVVVGSGMFAELDAVAEHEAVAGFEVFAGLEAFAGFEAVADVDVVPAVEGDVGIPLVAVDNRVGSVDAD